MKSNQSLKNLIWLVLALSLLGVSTSCQKSKPTHSESQDDLAQLFLKSFRGTLKYDVPLYSNARLIDSTLWLYIAAEKEILTIEKLPEKPDEAKKEPETTFLQIKGESSGDFKFYFNIYKIPKPITEKTEPSASGITENFTDIAQEVTNKIYSSMADLLFSSNSKNLKFFVVCIADIKKGIEMKTIINRSDLEKYVVNIIPVEEFHNRTIIKVKGDKKIVNDKTGKHLDYKDISLADFISELSVQQVKQEFSKFKEEEKDSQKTQELILKTLYKLSKIYEFNDFPAVETQDASLNKTQSLTRYELMEKFKDSEN